MLSNEITVIITCYNHERFVRQCIESVTSQSTFPNKIIICDDCSTDRTKYKILDAINTDFNNIVFLENNSNIGVCATLNKALRLVDTEFFIHISGDDWMESERLNIQLKGMKKSNENVAIGVSSLREVDVDGDLIVDHDYFDRLKEYSTSFNQNKLLLNLLRENVITAPSVILRTDAVLSVGGYDEKLMFEDYDLWLRLAREYSLIFIPGIVTNYRVIGNSMSRDPYHFNRHIFSEAQMLLKQKGRGLETDEIIRFRVGKIITTLAKNGSILNAMRLRYQLWVKRPLEVQGI